MVIATTQCPKLFENETRLDLTIYTYLIEKSFFPGGHAKCVTVKKRLLVVSIVDFI
jgi:hypothetical protein